MIPLNSITLRLLLVLLLVPAIPPNLIGAEEKSPTELVGKQDAPMVLVPAGEFLMRGDTNHRSQQVYLDAYFIDKFEVTNQQYKDHMRETEKLFSIPVGSEKYPVTKVDWREANNYCLWAGKRLPTDAEWEKAARGIDGRLNPWGNEAPNPLFANLRKVPFMDPVDENKLYSEYLAPVGTFQMDHSPYGAFDLAGNVKEWVADWWDPEYNDGPLPSRNPKGAEEGKQLVNGIGPLAKTIRGGSWKGHYSLFNIKSLSTSHWGSPMDLKVYDVGFRCAMGVDE